MCVCFAKKKSLIDLSLATIASYLYISINYQYPLQVICKAYVFLNKAKRDAPSAKLQANCCYDIFYK